MPVNPSLVPTPIVDATGKQTTVYRKPQSASSGAVMPSPLSVPQVDPDEAAERAMNELMRIYDSMSIGSDTALENLGVVAREDPDLLDEIVDHIENAGTVERDIWYNTLRSGVYRDADKTWVGEAVIEGSGAYRKYMVAYPLASHIVEQGQRFAEHELGLNLPVNAGNSVDAAMRQVNGDYGMNNENLRAAVIVHTIKDMSYEIDKYEDDRPDDEPEDTRFIAQHIDDVERVLDTLVERKTTDPEVIKLLLSSSPPIAEGAL